MYNLLVVEDEKNILKLMDIRLKKSGFNVFLADSGKKALEILAKQKIHLMIADIMMPVMNGYELVEKIRKDGSNLPIIMATAKETINDKTLAFRLGIDDYMTKPIVHEELVLRINAILKRVRGIEDKSLVFGKASLDYNSLSLREGKKCVKFTKKEFELLYKLVCSPDKVFTKEQLLNACWDMCEEQPFEETLKVHINRIRNKIKDFKQIVIVTVRGLGYKGVINV